MGGHPGGLAYDYAGETAEEQYSSLHSEEALWGVSEVFSQVCVLTVASSLQFVYSRRFSKVTDQRARTLSVRVWRVRGDVCCFSDVHSHLSHPLMLFLPLELAGCHGNGSP